MIPDDTLRELLNLKNLQGVFITLANVVPFRYRLNRNFILVSTSKFKSDIDIFLTNAASVLY
jgi:hypothetical protein